MVEIVIVWLHLLGVAAWVGGLLFGSHLVVPAILRGERGCVALLTRARAISWGAVALIAVTGLENLRRVGTLSPWLAGKLVFLLALLALAAHRDFGVLPSAARAIVGGAAPGAALSTLRWLDRALVVLALIVVLLGVGVARGH